MAAKVGSIVLATDQGLGYLARDFYKNGIIDKVYIHEHSSRPTHREWYSRESIVSKEELLECDSLLFFETPFDWKIIPKAREKGIKTVLMPMYECTQNPLPYVPDLLLAPSKLDLNYFPEATLITVPVSVQPRIRSKAEIFVHNAGNGGLGGRNGTKELLEALQYVKSPIKLIIRSQVPFLAFSGVSDPRVELRVGTFDNIWDEGDVFVFPEKFNGLSLPLQEAFASGMGIMCGKRYPMTEWLPQDLMIPVDNYKKERIAVEFSYAQFDPKAIAKAIDEWYGKDITEFSQLGITWGQQHNWENLKSLYEKLLAR